MAQRAAGGTAPSPMDINKARAAQFKTGDGLGIADPPKHAAWKQGMANDEAARRGLVQDRAMQVAQARTNRQIGMDPKTAAILAMLGDDSVGLGGMVAADALLGRGAGLRLNDAATQERIHNAASQAAVEKERLRSGGATGVTASSMAAPSAFEKRAAEDAMNIYRQGIADYGDPQRAASIAYDTIRSRYGMTPEDAAAFVTKTTGVPYELPKPKGDPLSTKFARMAPKSESLRNFGSWMWGGQDGARELYENWQGLFGE